MSGIFESILGNDEQVVEKESEVVGHSLTRAGIFHESDRIHSGEFSPTEPNVTYLGRVVEGSSTVEDLDFTGSVLPGNISTSEGNIYTVIGRFSDDKAVDAPDTGSAAVSNFYTRDGDIQVVVNSWDDDLAFKDVEERIQESPNFRTEHGEVTVVNGREDVPPVSQPGEDVDEHSFLSMGGYIENDFFTKDRLEEDWYREASRALDSTSRDGREVVEKRLAKEKAAVEQGVIEQLYRDNVIEVVSSDLDEYEVAIHDERLSIDEWKEKLEEEEMLPYKVEYNQHPGSFYKRDRYKVASEFIEEGIERLDEASDTDFQGFLDVFRTGFDQELAIETRDLLERIMASPEPRITMEDDELRIGVTTQVDLDMGILGMLPYREQLEEHGAEIPDPIGEAATTESEIDRYSDLDGDVQDRLEQLAEHEIIGLEVDEDEDRAELLTTNHRSNEEVSATVYSTWRVDELGVADGREEEFYGTMLEELLLTADGPELASTYESETARDLVRYELYNTVEDALDMDWDEEEYGLAFDQYRERIRENRLQNALVDRGLGGPGDMFVAVARYSDRR